MTSRSVLLPSPGSPGQSGHPALTSVEEEQHSGRENARRERSVSEMIAKWRIVTHRNVSGQLGLNGLDVQNTAREGQEVRPESVLKMTDARETVEQQSPVTYRNVKVQNRLTANTNQYLQVLFNMLLCMTKCCWLTQIWKRSSC